MRRVLGSRRENQDENTENASGCGRLGGPYAGTSRVRTAHAPWRTIRSPLNPYSLISHRIFLLPASDFRAY
jgi:hypothetical protein